MAKATGSGKGKAAGKGKATKGARPARPAARGAKGGKGGKPGKGKAPAKRFFVGKAPRPAEGRKGAPAARKAARPGLKEEALRAPRAKGARKPAAAIPPAPAVSAPVVPAPSAPTPPDEGQLRALAAVAAGFDKKAENPLVLDVRGLSGVADYFVLLSADSDRQAGAVADAVDARLTGMGAQRLGAEGRSGGGWVLLDFGDVVVHVMSPEARGFYDLEGLWADAPRVAVTP